ncbi:MAG TPA: pitrilysin family protein [Burkholderiales bacterium]|nr:pitrilysin family protein [Burkholderiales bacterium]
MAFAILPIQHWQTQNGARVYFVENRDIPMLDLSIDFAAGSGFDLAQKPGVASMTNHIMRLGAEGMTEDEIARKTADIGAGVSGRFDSDRAGLSMRTLSSSTEREQALEVFTRILHKPVFPAEVLAREKTRLIGALKEADIQPGTIVARTFNQLMYGAHPYGLRSSGDIESVPKITRDDLTAFYRQHYGARGAVIAIMGDVSRDEANAIAERVALGLPPSTANAAVLPPVEAKPEKVTRLIPHHASQSHILIGTIGIARGDPDYFPLFVGNYILGGGGFASRINEEVRQKRGLAYSAAGYFSPMAQKGPFVISMQTRKDQVQEALDVTLKTVRDFVANGPTAKELTDAKTNLVGGFPLRIDSNRKIHEYLAVIGYYNLPLTYLDEFVGNVERVGVADIKRAFAAHIDPEKLITVVVGAEVPEKAAVAPR